MGRRKQRVFFMVLSLSLLLVVLSGGNCPAEPPAARTPPKPVAGTWVGEVIGVRFRLSIVESGSVDPWVNSRELTGSGWLIYGTPAESVAVALFGANIGDPTPGVGLEFARPGGMGGSYGRYGGVLDADGVLLGPFERYGPSVEPVPSPWTDVWPAGARAVSLRLTRQ
jgi:hypothetical protein